MSSARSPLLALEGAIASGTNLYRTCTLYYTQPRATKPHKATHDRSKTRGGHPRVRQPTGRNEGEEV